MIVYYKITWDRETCDELIISKFNDSSQVLQQNEVIKFKNRVSSVACATLKRKCDLNAYFVCLFVTTLKNSEYYRNLVIRYLFKKFHHEGLAVLQIRLRMSKSSRHIIDYKWNNIINYLCYEKRELDTALAWLSTLGGAFSALGDQSQYYAVIAGRLSIHQFKIALKLGDPQTVIRCKLYWSLSLIQRGYLKIARNIIKREYEIVKTLFPEDLRLKRMCCGIWVRLQYEWRKKYTKK